MPDQATAAAAASNGLPPTIIGTPRLLLNQKPQAPSDLPFAAAPVAPIMPGNGYATVSYTVGTNAQRQHLTDWITFLAKSLPATIGNSDGTYIVTLRVKGSTLDIRVPIVSIQWTTTKTFLFFDKTVNDVKSTQWTGTMLDDIPIVDATKRLQYSIEIAFSKDRSLDFAFLKQASSAAQVGSIFSVIPIPAASAALIGSVSDLIKSVYDNSTKSDVVDAEEINLTTSFTKTTNLPITGDNQTFNLPVMLTVAVRPSRLVEGGLVNGKFDKNNISETLFDSATVVAQDKSVSLSELVATANDPKSKATRSFLDTLETTGSYTKDDVDLQCANLLSALENYVSKSDSRALFWAFLQSHAGHIDRNKCLGAGTLKQELDNLGLTF